jgi:hypothetical protein
LETSGPALLCFTFLSSIFKYTFAVLTASTLNTGRYCYPEEHSYRISQVVLHVILCCRIFIQYTKQDLRNCLVNELGGTFKPRSEDGANNVQCLIYRYYSRKKRLSPLLTCKQLPMQIWHQATKRFAIRGLGLNCWAVSAKWFV